MFPITKVTACILCLAVGFVKPDTQDDGYSGKVKTLFNDLQNNFSSNVNIAIGKMNMFSSYTWDRKYAIAIINLYTQESTFYGNLNFQMRNNYPSPDGKWKRSGDLINEGIDILGLEIHHKVYRGCTKLDVPPQKGKDFRFHQITSTSLSKTTALSFACIGFYIFEITDVLGVNVKKYSALGSEKEVFVKSINVFKVEKCPVKEIYSPFTTYYLNGQPSVNEVGKANPLIERNGANTEIKTNCAVALVLIFFNSSVAKTRT